MSLSVQKNRFAAVNRLGENTLQTVLQGKMELPSTAAPVGRIVWVKGTPVLQSFSTDQDRVYVQGVIDLVMVYMPETLEGEPAALKRVEWPGALPFDHYVEIIGAEPKMKCEVESTVLVCEWELRSGQYVLDVDLIVATTARVDYIQHYSVLEAVNIEKDLKLSTDGLVLDLQMPCIELEVNKEVTAILQLPEENAPARGIIDVYPRLYFQEQEVQEGSVLLKGVVTLAVLYEAPDYNIHEQVFAGILPFEFSLVHKDILPQMVVGRRIESMCQAFVVNEGRDIRAELLLEGVLQFQERRSVRILTEIIAPGNQIEVRKELIGLDSFVTEKEQQGVARGLVELGQGLPPIREILHRNAELHLSDYEIEEDKITLTGTVDVEFLYSAHSEEDAKPLFRGFFPEVLSFQQVLAIPGLEPGMQPNIELAVQRVQMDLINRETVEAVVDTRALVTVVEYLEVEVVAEAVEVEAPPDNPPTLTYVFVYPGDTIWKLSRQYHTTDEAIFQANPSLQNNADLLKPGDRLLIPRG